MLPWNLTRPKRRAKATSTPTQLTGTAKLYLTPTTNSPPNKAKKREAGFWKRFEYEDFIRPNVSTPCRVWVGYGTIERPTSLDSSGYGCVRWEGVLIRCSRVAWFLHYGEWPAQYVLHHCDNPRCGEKDHLFQGTHLENMRDAKEKGRKYVRKVDRTTVEGSGKEGRQEE